MKTQLHHDPAFYVALATLVLAALLLWAWEVSRQPAGPARVQWPASSASSSQSSRP